MLGPDDLNNCVNLALDNGLTDPSRRSLLLAWLPSAVIAHLPGHASPADQLRSDLLTLNGFKLADGRPAIVVWLENAERLVSYMPGLPEKLRKFRQRATRRAQEGVEAADPAHDTQPAEPPEKLGVLFLSAEPEGRGEQRLSRMLDGIRAQIANSKSERLELSDLHQTVDQFRISEIIEESTHELMHFAGSGAYRDDRGGWLLIQTTDGKPVPLHPDSVAFMIEGSNTLRGQKGARPLQCAIFSADYSADLAEYLQKKGLVNTAIGHTGPIKDDDIRAFSRRFYQYLAQDRSFAEAFEAGRRQVAIQRVTSPRLVTDLKLFTTAS